MQTRPNGPGIYGEIFLPASTRRTVLQETHRDRDYLRAMPDPQQIARELDRRLAAKPRTLRDVAVDYLALAATAPKVKP